MKRFLINIAALAFVFFLLILSQLVIYKYILLNFGKLEVGQDANTIVIGASSLETALDDSLIENTYNLCQGGDFILFDYAKIKKLHHLNPGLKTIILGFDPENLYGKEIYNNASIRLQYVRYFYLLDLAEDIDIIKYNPKTWFSGVVGISKSIFKIKEIVFANKVTDIGIGKYLPRPNISSQLYVDIMEKEIDPNAKIDPLTIKYFKQIIDYCKIHNLNLIVLNGPAHGSLIQKRIEHKKKYLEILEEYKEEITLWDYEDLIKEDSLFFNDNHLNENGAIIYSKLINEKLKYFKVKSI